jgi:hypothetical protein
MVANLLLPAFGGRKAGLLFKSIAREGYKRLFLFSVKQPHKPAEEHG